MVTVASLRSNVDRWCRFRRITGDGIRVAVEVTRRCNLRCPHCFVTRDRQTPPLEALLPVLEGLSDVHCKKVIVTGGEPLVRRDLERIVEVCAAQGMLVDLNSNLVALSAARARRLVRVGITEVSASLYGNQVVHDRFVDRPGAFERTLEGIRTLRALGVPVDIHCALGKHNIAGLDEIMTLCEELDCASLTFFTLIPTRRAEDPTGIAWHPGKETLSMLREISRHHAIPVRSIGLVDGDRDECVMGESIIGLSADMKLRPCLLARSCGASGIDLVQVDPVTALSRLREAVSQGLWTAGCAQGERPADVRRRRDLPVTRPKAG
jgi:MoaA/NifB/PqqE/SkfB family radical SAM enzyme